MPSIHLRHRAATIRCYRFPFASFLFARAARPAASWPGPVFEPAWARPRRPAQSTMPALPSRTRVACLFPCLALVCHGSHCRLDFGGIAKIVMTQGAQVVVQLVDQRLNGGNIQVEDRKSTRLNSSH